jgi:uncharacterized membrane protein
MKYTGIGGRRFTWTLVLVALVAAAPLHAQSWDDALDAFGEQIEADVVADDVGGVVAGVMVDGDLVWARAFG